MTRMTPSEAFVETLAAHGVKHIFGLWMRRALNAGTRRSFLRCPPKSCDGFWWTQRVCAPLQNEAGKRIMWGTPRQSILKK